MPTRSVDARRRHRPGAGATDRWLRHGWRPAFRLSHGHNRYLLLQRWSFLGCPGTTPETYQTAGLRWGTTASTSTIWGTTSDRSCPGTSHGPRIEDATAAIHGRAHAVTRQTPRSFRSSAGRLWEGGATRCRDSGPYGPSVALTIEGSCPHWSPSDLLDHQVAAVGDQRVTVGTLPLRRSGRLAKVLCSRRTAGSPAEPPWDAWRLHTLEARMEL